MRRLRLAVLILICSVGIPAAVYAQAVHYRRRQGRVGCVLPGVTVEASSPELIEKVRSVVTDGGGQYRIIDLRPGTYTVTFTLPGFSTVRREGIALTGTFTATVNADLRVGELQETVIVTGESPIVDVQSARQQQVIDRDALTSIPSSRMFHSIAALVPGITDQRQPGRRRDRRAVRGHVLGLRRPRRRRTPAGGRRQRRRQHRRHVVLRRRHRQRAGVLDHDLRRHGRSGGGRPDHQRRPAHRRQHAHRVAVRRPAPTARCRATTTPTRCALPVSATRRASSRSGTSTARSGGPLAARPPVVLRDLALSRATASTSRGCSTTPTPAPTLALCARPVPPGRLRLHLEEHQPARHLAGDASATSSTCSGTSSARASRASGGGSATTSPEAADGTTHMDYVRAPSVTWTSPVTNRLLLEAGWGYGGFLYGREREGNNRD